MWLLPSRGRPEKARRLAEMAPDAPIVLWLTEDDSKRAEYLRSDWPQAWEVFEGPATLRLAQILREFYRARRDLPYYGFIGDDVEPHPEDWYSQLSDAADDWYFAHPRDAYWGDKLAPHFCVGGELVRTVGWFALAKLAHSFIDTAWWALSTELGLRRYCEDVFFDHRHPLLKAAPMDATYMRGQETYAWDQEMFLRWQKSPKGLARDAERVLGKMPGFKQVTGRGTDGVAALAWPHDRPEDE